MAEGVRYIKVAKIDKNGVDQTNTLESLTLLTIPYSSGNVTYEIINTSEYSTYFLYYVENPNIEWGDRADLEYDFTGSMTPEPIFIIGPFGAPTIPIISAEKDSFNFYNPTTQRYILNTYPQKDLHFILTGSYSSTTSITNVRIYANTNPITNPNPVESDLDLIGTSALGIGIGQNLNVTGSYTVTNPGCEFIVKTLIPGVGSTTVSFTGSQFFITSSVATGDEIQTIPEPFFSEDWSRALDCQPTLNNVTSNRISSQYQDVDYSSGITSPVNFELLINGNALRAEVQDSNYSLLRHILPRYNGSRTTSQFLNKWTPGDTNTFGKSPTAESLKTIVAYCSGMGGNAPDKMNSSTVFIKYLIKANGDVIIPNTTPNSVSDNQGTFITNELIEINTVEGGGSGESQFRRVQRGGQRIENILYTQISHTQPTWTSSINLYNSNIIEIIEDNSLITLAQQGFILNNINFAKNIPDLTGFPDPTTKLINMWDTIHDPNTNFNNETYTVDPSIITSGTNLIIDCQFSYTSTRATNSTLLLGPLLNIESPTFLLDQTLFWNNLNQVLLAEPGVVKTANFSFTITPEIDFFVGDTIGWVGSVSNDEFYIPGTSTEDPGIVGILTDNSYFRITQIPLPSPLPSIAVSNNNIWSFPTSQSWSQFSSSQAGIIHIPNTTSSLNVYYGVPDVRQVDISESGFYDIDLDWSIKYGDEFRFEGREDRVYVVEHVFTPFDGSSARISNTGSVEVHFSTAIPSSSINLDHFQIRRYEDDASALLFEGLKPAGTSGPYIIKPQYLVDELDKNISYYIELLTSKGLIN